MQRRSSAGWVGIAGMGGLAALGSGTPAAAEVGLERVMEGLDSPVFVTHAPGEADRLFVVERGGLVRLFDLATQTLEGTPFLDVQSDVGGLGSEGGLLGLAFDPDYASNGRFFVNLTTGSGPSLQTEIRRYERQSATVADPASMSPVLTIAQPAANHNGGWIGFNPQVTPTTPQHLYIATGDGGGSNDEGPGHTPGIGNAQDITDNLLGKILRIDVSGDSGYTSPDSNPFVGAGGDDEILAYGLRNPYRASFDRATGELYIGDVGQGAREEISRLDAPLTDPTAQEPSRNLGWRYYEGSIVRPGQGDFDEPDDYEPPIYDYTRGTGTFEGNTVIGGTVYRGPVSQLQGLYIFGDYISGHFWAFDPADPDGTVQNIDDLLAPLVGTVDQLVSFGEDAAGNLYIVDLDGEVYQVVPEPSGLALVAIAAAATCLRRRRRATTGVGRSRSPHPSA